MPRPPSWPPVLTSNKPSMLPAVALAPTVATPAGAPATTAAAGTGAPAAPAPAATAANFAYLIAVGGDPDAGVGPTLGGRGGAKAPAATIPAAGAAAASRAESRARRRRRAALHDHADEFADMDSDFGVSPDFGDEEELAAAVASGPGRRGAGIRRNHAAAEGVSGGRIDQAGRRRLRQRPTHADGARHVGARSR